jgi:hypothetical protein
VLHTGRLFTTGCPLAAEVAETGNIRHEVHVNCVMALGDYLFHFDADHSVGEIVLLLAGYLAGMATGTVFVFDK